MSFYGSTYFQLIDTFYKILVKNKGGVSVDSAPATTEWASQASGRKGVLEFGTGNRWIYATQDPNNPNSYIFWHAKAGGEQYTKREFLGGQNVVTLPPGQTATILTPGSIIKAPQFEYDEAGHIATSNDVYYQMPISQTEEAIEDLKEKVGVPASEAEDGVSTGLFASVDEINDHLDDVEDKIDTTQTELGDYSKVFPVRHIFKDDPFFDSFGSMEDLRKAFFDDTASKKTFSEGFIEFKNATENMTSGNLALLQGHATLINENTNNINAINTEINALKVKDAAIDIVTNSLQQQIDANKAACDSNLAKEELRAEAEEARIAGLVTSEESRAKGEEKRIEGLVTSEEDRAKGEEERIEGLISAEQNRAKDEENRIVGLVETEEDRAKDEESRIEGLISNESDRAAQEEGRLATLIEANEKSIDELAIVITNNKNAAEGAASGLSDRITTLETESATSEEVNAVNTIVGQNTVAIASLGDTISEMEENISSSIRALQDSITSINGTIAQHGNTLSSKADSSTVATLETKVDNNKKAADDALALKAEKSAVDALQEEVNTKASTSAVTELASTISSKANQSEVNTLSALVNTKASQESLNDVAAAVDTKAGVDALEKYMGLANEAIAKLEAENAELRGLIEALTARVDALENPVTK